MSHRDPPPTPSDLLPLPQRMVRRRVPSRLGCVLLGVAWVLAACQGPMSSGLVAFHESRYPDAAQDLRQVDEASLSEDERARLALYLGLTELSLGNQRRAMVALERARCDLERRPDSLSPSERGRLGSAWRSLGRMPGERLQGGAACHQAAGN